MWTFKNMNKLLIFRFAEVRQFALSLQRFEKSLTVRYSVVWLPWKKIFKHFELFLFLAFVNQTLVI